MALVQSREEAQSCSGQGVMPDARKSEGAGFLVPEEVQNIPREAPTCPGVISTCRQVDRVTDHVDKDVCVSSSVCRGPEAGLHLRQ